MENSKTVKAKLTEKQKVVNKLIKWGHNKENAQSWADEHYEYASKHYSGVSKIAEVVSTIS